MNLSKVLRKYTATFDALEKFTDMPQFVPVRFNVIYLGDIEGDFFPVVIKDSKSGLGWLYGDAHAVIYKRSNNPLGIDLSSLKELAEKKFHGKQFIAQGMMPEADKLQKDDEGKITGFLSVNDVVSISALL